MGKNNFKKGIAVVLFSICIIYVTNATAFSASSQEGEYLQRWNSIVFSADDGSDDEIYIVGIDGSGLTQLTFNDYHDCFPVFSPDGKKIAFCSNRHGENKWWSGDIYIMNVDDTNVKRLTNSDGSAGPVFSPDGEKIVYHSLIVGQGWEIYTMNIDGSKQKKLTNIKAYSRTPSFSPDGKQVAFHIKNKDSGGWKLYLMNSDGSNLKRITNSITGVDEGGPCFSPDGKWIVYHANPYKESWLDEIYLIKPDGSEQTRLTNNEYMDAYPVFSPDGQKIAFVSNRDRELEIYIMNIDGSKQTRLTFGGGDDPSFSPMLINGRLLDIYGHWHDISE